MIISLSMCVMPHDNGCLSVLDYLSFLNRCGAEYINNSLPCYILVNSGIILFTIQRRELYHENTSLSCLSVRDIIKQIKVKCIDLSYLSPLQQKHFVTSPLFRSFSRDFKADVITSFSMLG